MAQIVIDVSSHQNPAAFNFFELKKHISGAILRVGRTYWGTGNSYGKDEQFEAFYKACKQHGIPVGAYWYSCADTTAEAMAEADKCFEWGLRGKQFELPIYWDTEDEHHQRKAAKGQLTRVAQAFLERLESRGYYVGIYASASWLNTKLDMDVLKDYDVWVAHYGVSKPAYNRPYGLWQYSSTARIAGYNGDLDASYMYKDYPTIIKKAGLNGFAAAGQIDLQSKPAPKLQPKPQPQPKLQTTPDIAGARFEKFENATFTFGKATNVRAMPSTTSSIVAVYRAGESVKYDRVYVGNGYVWISYIGGSGNRRYCAVRTYRNGARGVAWGNFR